MVRFNIKAYLEKVLRKFVVNFYPPQLQKTRNFILHRIIGKVSPTAEIRRNVSFRGNRIIIEDNVFINEFCKIYSHKNPESEIYLGKNVVLAMGVTLVTHTHFIGETTRRAPRETVFRPIHIEDGCWLGANVIVLPGVTIKRGTIIGAGSVVIHDCMEDSLYAGNPARLIRKL